MLFEYRAKSKEGQLLNGDVEAASLNDARSLLRSQGVFPLNVTQKKSSKSAQLNIFQKKVTKRDLLLMTTQLSIMHKSGLDLAEALKGVSQQVTNPVLKKAVEQILKDVEAGQSFSAALQSQSRIFGEAFVASIAAGEAAGNLGEVLKRLTELLRNEVRLTGTIRSVATYPLVLICVAFAVINALVFFVLPQFGEVFQNLDSPPPATTQFLLSVGETVRGNATFILLSLGFGIIGFINALRSSVFARAFDSFILETSMLKKATCALFTGRMFRLIGTMLQSGVPLLEAIRLCRRSIRNSRFQDLFDRFEKEVVNGNGLSIVLSSSTIIPNGAAQMIATAEQSGDLGNVMESIGEFYEDEGERHVRDLASLLEPLIIVVMGGVVALVVMSVILPLLDLSSTSSV